MFQIEVKQIFLHETNLRSALFIYTQFRILGDTFRTLPIVNLYLHFTV